MNRPLFISVILFSLVIFLSRCSSNQKHFSDPNVEEGYVLAQQYCKACHLLPDPSLLDRKTWNNYVLPKMAPYLGYMYSAGAYMETDDKDRPLSLKQWHSIVRYFLSEAPPKPLEREKDIPPIKETTSLFSEIPIDVGIKSPSTTLVKIDSNRHQIYFGDGATEYVYSLSSDLKLRDSTRAGTGIANLRAVNDSLWMLTMGVLYPSDKKMGKLALARSGDKNQVVILDSLQRPVHATYTDLNNDRLEDILVCEFGDQVGSLSWYENRGNNQYSRHVLRAMPGAIRTVVMDMNNDGRPDIISLMAQGDEGMFIYYNEGAGQFREERILRFPPSYGSNYFEMADFNNDGFPDIITSNGDNGDYPPILKAYHGIRIYLNDGKNRFTQKLFLPVNGIGKVVVADFDKDGDLDLASIAYFPDYRGKPREAFIYWENKGQLQFEPSSIANVTAGRWLTMDAADMDGDGDLDLVLGNANFRLGDIPADLKKKWDEHSPSILILKNNLH